MTRKKFKICIITGCSSGLGLEILNKISDSNKNILIYGVARNKKKLEKQKKLLNTKEKNNIFLKSIDISKEIKVKKFIKEVIAKHKRIDILVNNAGVNGPMGLSEKIDLKDWVKAFNINFFGSFYFFQNILPIMKKNKYGRIVQISGGGGTSPFPMFSSYGSAKAAIVRYAETVAKEIKSFENITINSIAPGTLNTSFTKIKFKAGPKKIGKEHYKLMKKVIKYGGDDVSVAADLCNVLINPKNKINGKIISAKWDNWKKITNNHKKINASDVFTVRRVSGKDRGLSYLDI